MALAVEVRGVVGRAAAGPGSCQHAATPACQGPEPRRGGTWHILERVSQAGRVELQPPHQLGLVGQGPQGLAGSHSQVGGQAGGEAVAHAAQALVVHHLPGARAEAALRCQRVACRCADLLTIMPASSLPGVQALAGSLVGLRGCPGLPAQLQVHRRA